MRYLALCLAACAAPDLSRVPEGRNTCSSACGATYRGMSEDCDTVQAVESELLSAYAGIFANACRALGGLTVMTRAGTEAGYWEESGVRVSGAWDYDTLAIELSDVPLRGSSLVHEIAHCLEYRTEEAWKRDPQLCNASAQGCGDLHYQWNERGINATIAGWRNASR